MSGIPETLEPLQVAIDDLTPYDANPRQGDIGAIVTSLERNGQYRPIVVNRRGNVILAGNHTYFAARELGWSEIAATYVDVDDEAARRIVLVDNRANDLAAYDDGALTDLLRSIVDDEGLDGLLGTGYDGDDLDALLADAAGQGDLHGDPDDVGDPPVEPITKPGDVWHLGDHVLVCGDATDPATYAHLDGKADAIWTDPPYGVSYVGKTADALTIGNDGAEGLPELLDAAIGTAWDHAKPGSAWYVASPPGPLMAVFFDALRDRGWRQVLIWIKHRLVLGHSDYHYRHEPIFYGYTPGYEGRRGRGGDGWHGDNAQDSLFEVDSPSRSKEHPTMKPVELIASCIANSTSGSALVLDPFCGSGSTIIAAEQLGRRAYGIELDPVYCDVICARFERLTRKAPMRDGEAYEFDVVAG